jgi:hypothetical protein
VVEDVLGQVGELDFGRVIQRVLVGRAIADWRH